MGAFGETLKRERESRAISLEEISSATKIATRSLRALEEEQFQQLPGGVFNRGFVRAYARYVGLDEEKAVADYNAAAGAQKAKENLGGIPQAMQNAGVAETGIRQSTIRGLIPRLPAVLALVLVVGTVAGLWWPRRAGVGLPSKAAANVAPPARSARQRPAHPTTNSAANPQAGQANERPEAQSVAAKPQNAVATASRQSGNAAWPIELELRAVSRAWIEVRVDGKDADQFMLDAAQIGHTSRSIHGQDSVVLVVGDPAGVEVTYNGTRLPAIGPKGLRSQVVFTPAGMVEN